MRLETEALNAAQGGSREALSCFLAIAAEISREPRQGLNKPLADWLPWLIDEGYSPDGIVDFVTSLLDESSSSQDPRFLHVAYEDALAKNLSTSRFLVLLRKDKPSEFRVFGEHLSKKSKEFLEINSSAGGKLTGPAATFIKHNPVISSYVLGLVFSFTVGTAIYLSGRKAKNEGITENTLEKAALQDAIRTTYDNESGILEQKISIKAANDSIQPERVFRNASDHPGDFVYDNTNEILSLQRKLLNKEDFDNFISLAMRDEDSLLLSQMTKEFVLEIKLAGKVWSDKSVLANKALEEKAKTLLRIVDEDPVTIIDPVTKEIKRRPITVKGSEDAYKEYDKALKYANDCTSDLRQSLENAYENYIASADHEKLKVAALAYEEYSIDANFRNDIDQNILKVEGAEFDVVMSEIENNEMEFTKEVVSSMFTDLEESADKELANLVQAMQEILKEDEDAIIAKEDNIASKIV